MKELLDKAKERGYTLWASSNNKNWHSLLKGRINLELWENGEFKLNFFPGILTLTTNKCGSFMNDEHFNKIENIINMAIEKIDD